MTKLVLLAAGLLVIAGSGDVQAQSRVQYGKEVLIQLGVADLSRAIDFYTKVLEFTMTISMS